MPRKISVFTAGDKPFILVSGVNELKGIHSAVPYETNYDLLTIHEEELVRINVTVKIDNEKTEREFSVNFHPRINRKALLNFAKGNPIWFTSAESGSIINDMLAAELQLELIKSGGVHIIEPNLIMVYAINTFLDQYQ